MTSIAEQLKAEVAARTQPTQVVVDSTSLGKDVLCIDSRRSGRYATGLAVVAQRCYHWLITPPGQIRGSKTKAGWGFGIDRLIGAVGNPLALRKAAEARIKTGLEEDPVIQSVQVTITDESNGSKLQSWAVDIRAQTGAGPFRLVVGVSSVSAELRKLETT